MARPRDKTTPTRRPERGLRPVQDVVGRIRFDPALDASRFVVGYEERFKGIREAPLAPLLGEGEVPWHRIWYIKAGELVVWDRKARVDLVFGSGDSAAADIEAIVRACAPVVVTPPAPKKKAGSPRSAVGEFRERPCHRCDPARGVWLPVTAPPPEVRVDALQVLTLNVLFDLYEQDRIYSERRVEACLALLQAQDADVVALQEVTPRFWATLLATPWVRARYCVSDGPDGEGLVPYGQALLSRWPLALEEHRFSEHKRLLLGKLAVNGRSLAVAAVHLTSNWKGDADGKRAEQLRVLAERLGRGDIGDAVVMGDLNFGDGEENGQLAAMGLTDAWQAVHPHHPGFTFDPVANPLAAIMSRTGRPGRYDRILLRAPAGALTPIEVTMLGDRPFAADGGAGLFVSDHFGLGGLLQLADVDSAHAAAAAATGVHTSALVIAPPEALWAPIQAIRAQHDPSFARWMPHINLLYGFVPELHFAAAAELVAEVARGFTPLRLRLDGLRRFEHRGSTTVWLAPSVDPPELLPGLQSLLAARFPGCDEHQRHGGFTPHLTVAKLTAGEREVAALVERWSAQLRPIEFTVDALHLISRRGDEPFAVRRSVPLGRPAPARRGPVAPLPAWGELPTPAHAEAVAEVARACAEALGSDEPCVHVIGSARLGVARPDADLDLVIVGADTATRAAVLADVDRRLGDALVGARLVHESVLRGRLRGLPVDLHFAGLPAPLRARGLAALTAAELDTLDPASRRAALGVVDADALARHVAGRPGTAAFRELLRRVRAWARARQLDVGAWGLLGGFTWALLAAHAAAEARASAPEGLLAEFFARWATWPSGQAVAFGPAPAAAPGRRAVWPVYTPTPPAFNSARGLTRSTHELLRAEFARAAAGPAELLAPVDASASRRRVVLTLEAADAEAEAACAGWLDGQVLSLILALEQLGAAVRPYPRPQRAPEGLQLALGVDGGPAGSLLAAAHEFVHGFLTWSERPLGATLTATLQA